MSIDETPPSGDSLKGRVALVTGAGRGIGRAIAAALSDAGASVCILSRTRKELDETTQAIRAAGGTALIAVADVTNAVEISDAVSMTQRTLGPIEILVNNAGILGPLGPFAQADPAEWWRSVEVNVMGPLNTIHCVLPAMLDRGSGCIINVVTGMAPFPYFSGYCAGKAALVRFSECLATEVKSLGVSVFPMGPGTVRTQMSEHSLNSDAGKRWIPWFKKIFDDGLDLPPDRPASLAVQLAGGKYDALSGLVINPFDDLDEMLARRAEIEREKLYSLRVRSLPNPLREKVEGVRELGTKENA